MPLQGPTAAVLHQSDRLGLLRTRDLELVSNYGKAILFGSSLGGTCRDALILPKSVLGVPVRVSSRLNAYQAKS